MQWMELMEWTLDVFVVVCDKQIPVYSYTRETKHKSM